jgi:acyl-CoA reductase-like NAD-dependent aldehyde dehydrogenase
VARRLRSGFVEINAVATPQPADTGPFAFEPFGMSGLGAYGGIAGIQAFTKMQGAIFNLR